MTHLAVRTPQRAPRRPSLTSRWAAVVTAAALLLTPLALPLAASAQEAPLRVLVYSATFGFRHSSIPAINARFELLGATSSEVDVVVTEEPGDVAPDALADVDVLVLNNMTGEHPFSAEQREGIMGWLERGGGMVGLHAAVDSNYDWVDFHDALGVLHFGHPYTGPSVSVVEEPEHPLAAPLRTDRVPLVEEHYYYAFDPRPNVRVLTSIDPTTVGETEAMYGQQPNTWCQDYQEGRVFYTNWGHFETSIVQPHVFEMLTQAVRWAGGRLEADCAPTEAQADRLQAERADEVVGARTALSTLEGGESTVTDTRDGSHLLFRDVDLTGITAIEARLSVETSPIRTKSRTVFVPEPARGGSLELRLGGVDGPVVATLLAVPGAPGWRVRQATLAPTEGRHDLYAVFSDATHLEAPYSVAGAGEGLFTLDWLRLLSTPGPSAAPTAGSAAPRASAPTAPDGGVAPGVTPAGDLPATGGPALAVGLALLGAGAALRGSRRSGGLLLAVALVGATTAPAVAQAPPIGVVVLTAGELSAADAEVLRRLDEAAGTGALRVDRRPDVTSALSALATTDVLVLGDAAGAHAFDGDQRRALEAWVAAGGGVVALNGALAAHQDWAGYHRMLGATTLGQPFTGPATHRVVDPDHALVAQAGGSVRSRGALPLFELDPSADVRVLTAVDATALGVHRSAYGDQPTSWCKTEGEGRVVTAAWGDDPATFAGDGAWSVLRSGLAWAAGTSEADCAVDHEGLRLEAEHADAVQGARTERSTASGGQSVVTEALPGGFLRFAGVDLGGATELRLAASPETVPPRTGLREVAVPAVARSGSVEVRLGAVDGPRLATIAIPPAAPTWRELTVQLRTGAVPAVPVDLYVVFSADRRTEFSQVLTYEVPTQAPHLFSIDWLEVR